MSRLARIVDDTRVGIGAVRRWPDQPLRRRVRLVLGAALVPTIGELSPGRSLPITVEVAGRPLRFRVTHVTDLLVLWEVLFGTQYARPALEDPKLIVDAGSHIGASVAYFASRYPGARIVGIEASPTTFRRLTSSVGALPNVELLNVALGERDGVLSFFERAAAWESSATASSPDEVGVEVPVLSLESLLQRIGTDHIDLLKLDIEGAEWPTLRAFPRLAERVAALVTELHTWMPGVGYTDDDILGLLSEYDVEDDDSGSDRMIRAVRTAG